MTFYGCLGFSFAFHQVSSARHSVSRVGSAQDQLLHWSSGVFPWIIDGPSHSAPHVPMYHYAALRRASITSRHWISAITPDESISTSSSLVAWSRNSMSTQKQPPRNLRDQHNYISHLDAVHWLISNLSNVLARSFVDSLSKLEYLDTLANMPTRSSSLLYAVNNQTIQSIHPSIMRQLIVKRSNQTITIPCLTKDKQSNIRHRSANAKQKAAGTFHTQDPMKNWTPQAEEGNTLKWKYRWLIYYIL